MLRDVAWCRGERAEPSEARLCASIYECIYAILTEIDVSFATNRLELY